MKECHEEAFNAGYEKSTQEIQEIYDKKAQELKETYLKDVNEKLAHMDNKRYFLVKYLLSLLFASPFIIACAYAVDNSTRIELLLTMLFGIMSGVLITIFQNEER